VRHTVERFLPATVDENEPLFERYPRYVLSFEGAWRYRLLAEHDPRRFAVVRRRVAEGRWFPAGAALEAFDALLPSPESIGRQILYGRAWMRRELGIESRDLFLLDCFGFPRTLPTIAAHFDIAGFTTQKLRRREVLRSAFGIPFALGRWIGAGGAELLAVLDPGEYSARVEGDPRRDPAWLARFAELTAAGRPSRLVTLTGIGDKGGAPPAASVAALEAALAPGGPIEVRHGSSQAVFDELADSAERSALPTYDGELLLRVHGTGCYTAKARLKRWHREVERLARVAETATALARHAGAEVAVERLEEAWSLLLAHEMHDDLTGTSIPEAYGFSFADLGAAANLFREVALDALDTLAPVASDEGATVAVLSPLATRRRELVEISPPPVSGSLEMVDESGAVSPVQTVARPDEAPRLLLPISLAGLGIVSARLRPASGRSFTPGVEVSERHLENRRYRLELDSGGAVASLVDRRLDRELLAAPVELQLLPDRSSKYPAWEILWRDISHPPLDRVYRPVRVEIVERGPLRAALRVERYARGCRVIETWSLADEGELVAADVELEWRRRARLLKACWHFTASDEGAHYDDGLRAVRRPIATEGLYEVPSQGWAAIVDRGTGHGAALFAEGRFGWDQPDASTLRSTWIHAPRASWKWRHQATQDRGRHRFRFGVSGVTAGDLESGRIVELADRFAHPPIAFAVERGPRAEGTREPLPVRLDAPWRLLALKPSEEGDALVARLANSGDAVARTGAIDEAFVGWSPCDGLERTPAPALDPTAPGSLFALRSPARSATLRSTEAETISLPFDRRAFSANGVAVESGFDDGGRCLPLELLPERGAGAVAFDLSAARAGAPSALAARGQRLALPADALEIHLLAASVDGDRPVKLELDDSRLVELVVPDWRRPLLVEPRRSGRSEGKPGADRGFRRRPLALRFSHLHDRHGNDLAVEVGMLFVLRVPLSGARRLRLPDDPAVRVVAVSASRGAPRRVRELDAPRLP